MKKLEWVNNKVTVHRVEVQRRALGKERDQGWRVAANFNGRGLEVPAIDARDTDVCAYKLALAVLTLYDESIPHALVKVVNTNAREFCGGITAREEES